MILSMQIISKLKSKLLLFFFVTAFFSCKTNSQSVIDKKACSHFESQFSIATTYSKLEGTVIKEDTDEVIHFLEMITEIESEAELGYSGYDPPTENDLKKWQDWYKENKHLLYWDDQEQKVKVKKE